MAESTTGLDVLKSVDRVVIREKWGSYPNSKYVVLTAEGAALLYAKEDSGIISKVLVGKSRAFEIDVFDTNDLEVMKLRHPYTVGQDKLEVVLGGALAAVVRKEVTFFKPVLAVNDPADRLVLRVKGPVSMSAECNFELYSADKQRIGGISKCWSSAGADRDSFALRFPQQLDVRYKAALIGACFLIDFLFYDN